MASDFELSSQLYSFMEAVPVLWTWERLKRMHEESDSHTEQRGPDDNIFQFKLSVLEDDLKHGERYLHLLVSITDPTRKIGERGSSNTPLCTSFLFFQNGETDMPLAREIYERSY
jgi:hypothetical protein